MLRTDSRLNTESIETGMGSGDHARARPRAWFHKNLRVAMLCAAVLIVLAAALFFRSGLWAPSEHVVLSLRGSTSLGDELMPRLAAAFLRDDMQASETGFERTGRDARGQSHLHVWGKVPGRAGLQVIDIYATGSGAAFECLAADSGANSCDIGMSSRPINDADKASYPGIENLDRPVNEHVVALDGIAVIVHPLNPVSQLSIPQLRAIYKGEIRNWKDVGGNEGRIELFGRDANSGTFEMFTEKVIGKNLTSTAEPSAVAPDHQIADSRLIEKAVTRTPNAIGYVSSTMVRDAKALSISDGSGPAISPTELSIVTEDYPICRRLLLYDWDSPGSVMDAFVRYVVYKPGQELVAQTPFVELTPRIFPVTPPQDAPPTYKEIARNYSRIGLSFHFSDERKGSEDQLDSLARVNVLRLRTFLAQRDQTGNDILLIGFADDQEESTGRQVAQLRAQTVATSLRAIGVVVPTENVLKFGAALPVASNDTPEGRRRNRRVEVWVRNTAD